jgi:hypothetical protein
VEYTERAIGHCAQIGSTSWVARGIEERHPHFRWRSSSAWAEKAEAWRRISLAASARDSPAPRLGAAHVPNCRALHAGLGPAPPGAPISAVQPILLAIEPMAAHCDSYSLMFEHQSHRPLAGPPAKTSIISS